MFPKNTSYRFLGVVLWLSSFIEMIYFTASHWFFHRAFFNFLGIRGAGLESSFVQSQLQLIGLLVLGYAFMNMLIATDPLRYRPLMVLIFGIGLGCIVIFIGHVMLGTLPAMFLINALLLALQLLAVGLLFPWRDANQIK